MVQGRVVVPRRALAVTAIAGSTVLALTLGASASAAVRTDSSRIVGRVRNSADALWVTVSPNGRTAYATTYDSNTLDVIDLKALKRLRVLEPGSYLTGVSVSNNGQKLFMGAQQGAGSAVDDRTMTVMSARSGRVVARVSYCDGPAGNAVSPNGKVLYQACTDGDSIAKVDTKSNAMIGEVLVGLGPLDVAFSPNGAFAYSANAKSSTVSIIDTTSGRVVGTIPVGREPSALAVSPDGTRLFVSCTRGRSVWLVDTSSRQVVGKVPVPTAPTGLAVSPDGSRLYVGTNGVMVVDVASLTVVGTISLQTQNVADLVLLPDGTRLVAVAGAFTYVVDVVGYSGP